MSIRRHVLSNAKAFRNVFEAGLSAAFVDARAKIAPKGRSPEEPEYVEAIFRIGLPLWDLGLTALFRSSGYQVRVGGVFCHKSSKVKWDPSTTYNQSRSISAMGAPPHSIEIGDLLIIARLRTPTCSENRALLLQSKTQPIGAGLPSDDQFILYNRWPEFEYIHGALKGMSRIVTPAPNRGGQYHLIDAAVPNGSENFTCMASALPRTSCLRTSLVGILTGREGRDFPVSAPVPATSDWDQVVWDLLQVTYSKVFTLNSVGANKAQRGFNCLLFGNLSDTTIRELSRCSPEQVIPPPHSPHDIPTARDDEIEPEGISLIVIDVTSEEL